MRVRRSRYLYVSVADLPFPDIRQLLRGKVTLEHTTQIYGLSLALGEQCPLSAGDVDALLRVPAHEWLDLDTAARESGRDVESLMRLARYGLLITDPAEGELAVLRQADERLVSLQWNPYAAVYHFMTRWRDVDVEAHFPSEAEEWRKASEEADDVYRQYVAQHGKPPPEFYEHPRAIAQVPLPLKKRSDGIFGLLDARRTTRAFEPAESLGLNELSCLLYYVFGCQGTVNVFEDIVGLKKTSPSGGCLHPVEVYPLILNVGELSSGLYHYEVGTHSLALLREMVRSEAEELAAEFTAGQSYLASAQALFVMTVRFYRNYWKYRRHPKAYAVVLMDAAHLSQTFYLVATALGLGPFVTAAINSKNIETSLQLDPVQEGPVLICACGTPASANFIDPSFAPFDPVGQRDRFHG